MTLLFCFGTRPEWLKIKPIIQKLQRNQYKLLFTGQHQDLIDDVVVDHTITPHHTTSVTRLDQVVSDCIMQFPAGDFDGVVVQGDTASTFGCALAAYHRKLPLLYVEAGLRSYNLNHPYPEEGYRQMISRLATVCYAPTDLSAKNLTNELVNGQIVVTGNTSLDNLVWYKSKCQYLDKVLVTMHRRENHGDMDLWLIAINQLAIANPNLKFIMPIHPNPNVQRHRHLLTAVQVVDPLPHDQLLQLLVKVKLVITDSGGLQEEGSFFNKKVIVCRQATERPEAIATGHLHLCPHPAQLASTFYPLIAQYYTTQAPCPYGDGMAADRIISHIKTTILR